MRSTGPDTTQSSGALMAAMLRPAGMRCGASASGSDTLSMPPAGSVSNSRPRRATSRMPSSHADDAGEAGGHVLAGAVADHRGRARCPSDSSSLAMRVRGREQRGQVRPTAARAGGSLPRRGRRRGTAAWRRSSPSCGLTTAQHASIASRYTGSCSYSSRAHAGVLRAAARHHEHHRRARRACGGW